MLEIGDGMRRVDAVDWYAYATNQIELLVAAGLAAGQAARSSQGIEKLEEIKFAIIERNGKISVIRQDPEGG